MNTDLHYHVAIVCAATGLALAGLRWWLRRPRRRRIPWNTIPELTQF